MSNRHPPPEIPIIGFTQVGTHRNGFVEYRDETQPEVRLMLGSNGLRRAMEDTFGGGEVLPTIMRRAAEYDAANYVPLLERGAHRIGRDKEFGARVLHTVNTSTALALFVGYDEQSPQDEGYVDPIGYVHVDGDEPTASIVMGSMGRSGMQRLARSLGTLTRVREVPGLHGDSKLLTAIRQRLASIESPQYPPTFPAH